MVVLGAVSVERDFEGAERPFLAFLPKCMDILRGRRGREA